MKRLNSATSLNKYVHYIASIPGHVRVCAVTVIRNVNGNLKLSMDEFMLALPELYIKSIAELPDMLIIIIMKTGFSSNFARCVPNHECFKIFVKNALIVI